MNTPNGNERLIFVGGCPRSGTTLVQNILDSHPEIFGGPEFLHLADLIDLRKKLQWSISAGWIDLYFSHEDLDHHIRTLIQNIFLPLADKQGCTYMSEKSPMNVLSLSELVEIFPESHFIHVIRDPRAIVSSMRDVNARAKQKQTDIPHYTSNTSLSIEYTRRCLKAGFSAVKKTPDKILTVVYESLAKDPEKESKNICKFLGLKWDSRMMNPKDKKHMGEKAITTNSGEIWYDINTYYQNPHDKNIEKWKRRLSPFQQIRITRAFKDFDELKTLGYDFSLNNLPQINRILMTVFSVCFEFCRAFYHRFISLTFRVGAKIPR